MSRTYSIETTVLGGLPVTVEYFMAGPDPDVGITSSYVEEWCITEVNGKKRKNLQWIEDRIYKKKGEEERLVAILNKAGENDYDDFD